VGTIRLTPSSFTATAGKQNAGSTTQYQALVPASDRAGLFMNGNYRLAAGVELFGELLASEYDLDFVTSVPRLPSPAPNQPSGWTYTEIRLGSHK
jgi:hypothetical protein